MKRSRDGDDDGGGGDEDGGRSSVRPRTSGGIANKLTTMDALTYLREIRETFQDEKEIYAEFLEAMKDFKTHRVDTPSIIARVRRLFEGYPDLILGFNTFLPKEFQITIDEPQAKKPVDFNEAFQFVNKIKARFQGDERSYSSFLSILSMYKNNIKSVSEIHQEVAALLHNQPDLLEEFGNFLPSGQYAHSSRNHNRSLPPIGTIRPRHPEKKPAVSVEMPHPHRGDEFNRHAKKEKMKREDREHRSQDRGFDYHRTNHLTHKRKPASALEDSAPSLKKLEDSVIELFHEDMRDDVLCVREKVKRRLNGSDNYRKFLSCIVHYGTRDISRSNLENLVNDILGAYPDIIEEVNEFIDRSETAGSLWSGNLPESVKADDEDQDRERDVKNISVIKDEYQAKPIHELDLSDCLQCGPSYRRLPNDYPIPKVSARTKEAAEVLNDHWVSVTSGSEDYSFKHMRKNQYEESLFRCEDDRYELDMLIGSAKAAAKGVEELLKKIDAKVFNTDCEINYEEHLSVLNVRCIERLYGDNGLEVLDVLKKNASLALPVILTRLKQKQDDWERCRSDFNKTWADIYAKNHQKSLDHRSFYFKQQDSKSLSAKALLSEIKEISEEKAKEENIYHHFATGKRKNATPHQEFEYCDLNVHEDLYKLIGYYIPHNSTSEQFDRIKNIWTTFVEPMFNVRSRLQLVNGDHEAVKTSKKESDSNGVKENGSHIEKVKREEGEVSPKGAFEEDNFTASRENGAGEEGEESTHRSSCDTENPSENGEGSGSETADVEDHSHQDHDGVHDKKTKRGGEEDETHLSFLETAKPLTKYVPATSHNNETDPRVFYGNDTFYVFFRLHHTLYSRLKEAKENSANGKGKGSNDTTPNDSYTRFLDLLYSFLGGVIDSTKYEDDCRAILGTWSFPVFTLDKLIHKLSKQLLAIATDEVENKLIKLHAYEHMRKHGRFADDLYNANARVIVNDETIYRFSHSLIPETNRQTRLTIRLMDSGCEAAEAPAFSVNPSFVPYPVILPLPVIPGKKKPGVFLKRNKRKYASEDEDLAMKKATEGLHTLNRIEIKMDCSTYRVAYVLGTEDSMVRRGRKKTNHLSLSQDDRANLSNGYSHHVQKFRKWLQSKIPASM